MKTIPLGETLALSLLKQKEISAPIKTNFKYINQYLSKLETLLNTRYIQYIIVTDENFNKHIKEEKNLQLMFDEQYIKYLLSGKLSYLNNVLFRSGLFALSPRKNKDILKQARCELINYNKTQPKSKKEFLINANEFFKWFAKQSFCAANIKVIINHLIPESQHIDN